MVLGCKQVLENSILRRQIKMEMCYNEALVMPCNYVVMDNEEMEYVDGGAIDIISNRLAGAIFNTAIGMIIGGAAVGSITAYIARVGAKEAAKIFTKTLTSKLIAIGCSALAVSICPIVTTVLNYLDVGNAIANKLDSIDSKPNNGWLSVG
jgi:hypothetical protein